MNEETDPTPAVISAVERGVGAPCTTCGRGVCGHEVVMSYVLGFKETPRCIACLARGLARAVAGLRASLIDHIEHRDCWRAGWRRADELESAGGKPRCLAGAAPDAVPEAEATPRGALPPRTIAAPASAADSAGAERAASAEWDAGDLGCGDLVLELRLRMKDLRPGEILKLTARDPGAPADLPAWCGLTGHTLLAARHPVYLLQRRDD